MVSVAQHGPGMRSDMSMTWGDYLSWKDRAEAAEAALDEADRYIDLALTVRLEPPDPGEVEAAKAAYLRGLVRRRAALVVRPGEQK
jgi:hypothetical protein